MKTTQVFRVLSLLLCLYNFAGRLKAAGPAGNWNNINMNMNNRMPPPNMPTRNLPPANMPQGQRNNQTPNFRNPNSAEYKIRRSISDKILRYMNFSVDPCESFYDYACGNWQTYHSNRLREGELGTALQLQESEISKRLQEILRLPLPPPNHPNEYSPIVAENVGKVISFYGSCLAANPSNSEGRQFLRKILEENGGIHDVPNSNYQPNINWLRILFMLRKNYGLDILIGFSIDLNLQQLRGNSVYLGEPELTIIPAEHCNAQTMHQTNFRDEIYEQIQQQVASNMNNWFGMPTGSAARFAGDIIRFEFELCKRMREQSIVPIPSEEQQAPGQPPVFAGRSRTGQERLRQQPGGSSHYPRVTLAELTAQMGNSINFKTFVDNILERNYVDYVYLRSQNYLSHLVRTAANASNQQTIPGYIIYLALVTLNRLVEDQTLLRAEQCVQVVKNLFPEVLGDMYQRQVQNSDAQNDISEVFNGLVRAFEQMLRTEWLNDNDSRAARTRLEQYHLQFPDYQGVDLSQLQFQKSDNYWHKLEKTLRYNAHEELSALNGNDFGQSAEGLVNAFEVRAGLLPRKQTVLAGWGLLQSPFYNYLYPKSLKFSHLGYQLAKALMLAFDDEGWNNYPQATATWSEQTLEGYKNVSDCHRAAYSSYLSDDPNEFRNATRLREIIADSNALNVAFRAYLDWLEQQSHLNVVFLSRETLSDLNFSNTQLFFIFFAQAHCWARNGEEPALEAMPLMQHTPERWSVNGPLSNSAEFGREFGCPLGSPMNSGNKCLVYS